MNIKSGESGDMKLEYVIKGMDFITAGEASSNIKRTLQLIGFPPDIIRRTAIVAYEAEMNIVIHATEGIITTVIRRDKIDFTAADKGPGIPDIHLALKEGYSTAPDRIRKMGFGAGMGLPNIKNSADKFDLNSTVGEGTILHAVIFNR